MTCLWVCWFFLLLDQVCYWTPLVKFSIIYCIFQLNFVWFFKIFSVCWYSHSYHLTYHFPKLIARLHDYFKLFLRWFTYLISLGSVSKDLVCFFVGPCFFLCLFFLCVCVCWHPHIWKKSQLQSFRLALYRERSSPISLNKDSWGPSNLFCGCIFSGLTCVNSQLERICWFLFSGVCNLLLPLVSVYCTAGSLKLL